jgi:hypothetical protein
MAAFHGKSGSVTFNAVRVEQVINWSIEATCDTAEGTFMAAVDAPAWVDDATTYEESDLVSNGGVVYRCVLDHTSTAATDEPGAGTAWQLKWTVADWKLYALGIKRWTATVTTVLDIEGYDPDLATDLKDDNGAVLTLKTGLAAGVTNYTGTAIVTGINTAVDINDVTTVTYEFIGSGSLTETTV